MKPNQQIIESKGTNFFNIFSQYHVGIDSINGGCNRRQQHRKNPSKKGHYYSPSSLLQAQGKNLFFFQFFWQRSHLFWWFNHLKQMGQSEISLKIMGVSQISNFYWFFHACVENVFNWRRIGYDCYMIVFCRLLGLMLWTKHGW